MAGEMDAIFGFPTRVVPLLDDISFAHDPDRNQYHSTPVLERLESLAPKESIKVLGITTEDLFIPILTHVYGEAQLGGKACIVSISRLVENTGANAFERGGNRIIKEAAHELGHTFDLKHCEDENCLMHYCRGLEDVDRKSRRFCRYCKILLDDYARELIKVL